MPFLWWRRGELGVLLLGTRRPEEASPLGMVDAFYGGMTGLSTRSPPEGVDAVVYQRKTKGDYLDTTAAETAQIAKGLLQDTRTRVSCRCVRWTTSPRGWFGFPVCRGLRQTLEQSGISRNGGPLYHMLS